MRQKKTAQSAVVLARAAALPTQALPATLGVDDVQGIVRLFDRVIAAGGDIAVQKRVFLTGLANLTGADVWMWVQSRVLPGDLKPMAFSMMDGGWADERQKGLVFQAAVSPAHERLISHPLLQHLKHPHVTRTRDQVVSDDVFYASDYYRTEHQLTGLDDSIFSLYRIGPHAISAIALHRRVGRPRFTARDRCVVHVVCGGIDFLHRAGANLPAAEGVTALSTRERQVLLLLLGGDGLKQIAVKLNLSGHTVGDYIKSLHKHFEVNSRTELLALFMSGRQQS